MDENRRQAIHLCVLAGCIYWGSRWGLAGVAGSVIIAAFVYWVLLIQLLRRRMQLPLLAYVKTLAPASLSCLIMYGAVLMLQNVFLSSLSDANLLNIVAPMVLGVLIYFCSLWSYTKLSNHEQAREALDIAGRGIANFVKPLARLVARERKCEKI